MHRQTDSEPLKCNATGGDRQSTAKRIAGFAPDAEKSAESSVLLRFGNRYAPTARPVSPG
jgi:hypothetical protein